MKKRILHLTLKKKWFDLIASGEKKIEYRDLKPYWSKRLTDDYYPKKFDEIYFTNGYGKDKPFMRVEWKGMKGVELCNNKGVYAIELGKVLEIKNYKKRGVRRNEN